MATTLMRFMVRLSGMSASPMTTAMCPRPPPGTQAVQSRPKRMSFSMGRTMARPKASCNHTTTFSDTRHRPSVQGTAHLAT